MVTLGLPALTTLSFAYGREDVDADRWVQTRAIELKELLPRRLELQVVLVLSFY